MGPKGLLHDGWADHETVHMSFQMVNLPRLLPLFTMSGWSAFPSLVRLWLEHLRSLILIPGMVRCALVSRDRCAVW